MLLHTQLVKQDIVLWTHAQVLTNTLHLCADVMTINGGRARSGREQACQDGPGTIQKGESKEATLVSDQYRRICILYGLDNMQLIRCVKHT